MTWSAAYTPPWLACKLLRCALVIITQLEIILVQYLLDYLCNMIISKAVVPSVIQVFYLLGAWLISLSVWWWWLGEKKKKVSIWGLTNHSSAAVRGSHACPPSPLLTYFAIANVHYQTWHRMSPIIGWSMQTNQGPSLCCLHVSGWLLSAVIMNHRQLSPSLARSISVSLSPSPGRLASVI